MLIYLLFIVQSMLLSATSSKGQLDAGLHPIQNPEHASVSNKQKGPARCQLTAYSKPIACSCQKQAGRVSQILTYMLFKTQSMLPSATSRKNQYDADLHPVQSQSVLFSVKSRKGQSDADLHPVQNPKHAPLSNKQEGPARC